MKKTAKKALAARLCLPLKWWYSLASGGRIKFGKNVIVNHRFRFTGKGRLHIGDNAILWAHKEPNEFITFGPDALIEVGARTRLNGLSVQCKKHVSIGADCMVGSSMIMDTDFHSIYFDRRDEPEFVKTWPVIIKDRVWLAGQCAILKGVTVHEEAVVGFRAVVAKDVPAKTVVAGNPAREVSKIEPA